VRQRHPKTGTGHSTEKLANYRFKTTLRRMRNNDDDDDESLDPSPKRQKTNKARRMESTNTKAENSKFEGELTTTEKGLLRFDSTCWKTMDDKEKEFVRDYNAAIKHGEPTEKVPVPSGVTVKNKVRRTAIKREEDSMPNMPPKSPKTTDRRKKGVTFGLSEEDHTTQYTLEDI
jgi:hypothetical protein